MAKIFFAVGIVLLSATAVGQLPQVTWQTVSGTLTTFKVRPINHSKS
jgi:hypothetical protein